MTKDTQALMGVGGAVATDGTGAAGQFDREAGVLFGHRPAQGLLGVAGSASVLVLSAVTSARMLGSDIAGGGAKVRAKGNLVVEATDASEIDILAARSWPGSRRWGAGVAVPVITRTTRAEIGANVDAVALGLAGSWIPSSISSSSPPAPAGRLNLSLPQGGSSTTPWTRPVAARAVPGDQDGRQDGHRGRLRHVGRGAALPQHRPCSAAHSGTGVLGPAATAEDIAVYGLAGGSRPG